MDTGPIDDKIRLLADKCKTCGSKDLYWSSCWGSDAAKMTRSNYGRIVCRCCGSGGCIDHEESVMFMIASWNTSGDFSGVYSDYRRAVKEKAKELHGRSSGQLAKVDTCVILI